jgi:hypothetical protein
VPRWVPVTIGDDLAGVFDPIDVRKRSLPSEPLPASMHEQTISIGFGRQSGLEEIRVVYGPPARSLPTNANSLPVASSDALTILSHAARSDVESN